MNTRWCYCMQYANSAGRIVDVDKASWPHHGQRWWAHVPWCALVYYELVGRSCVTHSSISRYIYCQSKQGASTTSTEVKCCPWKEMLKKSQPLAFDAKLFLFCLFFLFFFFSKTSFTMMDACNQKTLQFVYVSLILATVGRPHLLFSIRTTRRAFTEKHRWAALTSKGCFCSVGEPTWVAARATPTCNHKQFLFECAHLIVFSLFQSWPRYL